MPLVVLTGLSGSGKSTVGRLLAADLDVPFVDLDDRIAERAGLDVGSIFEKLGEAQFREMERVALRDALGGAAQAVIATGGGTLANAESRALALSTANVVVIWLQVSPERAAARCAASEVRPLLATGDPAAALASLLERREAAYAEAHVAVSTDGRSADQVLGEIHAALAHHQGAS